MSVLDLKRTSLVVVGTRAHEMTKLAINDMLKVADFRDVLIYTDAADKIAIPGARYWNVPDWDNKKDAGAFYYSQAMANVETDYGFLIEWDAGIFDPKKWQDQFLAYDYIGAPWMTTDNHKVGNGGFTIMSKRLGHFLCNNKTRVPVCTDWEVCRTQRPRLELEGFKYAPYALAHDFSWELINPRSPNTFGYHGIFNWPDMIGRAETVRRVRMMIDDPYLATKLNPLLKMASVSQWLPQALGNETYAKYAGANRPKPRPAHPALGTPAHVFKQQQIRLTRELAYQQLQRGQKA